MAGLARRWFMKIRRRDDLSRLLRAMTGSSADLTRGEFDAVRKFLEDEQTWVLLGQAPIDDLADSVSGLLPPRLGRTAEDAHSAGLAVVRGLLEYAAADLEPEMFQKVLLTRLTRMQADQVSALDHGLLGLNVRFDSVLEQITLARELLPPGPAGRAEIVTYLGKLIDWLATDQWPLDPRFGGIELAAADIEARLRITITDESGEQELAADTLVQQCRRLVILGEPGSGKTWLARRAARLAADEALRALAAGAGLDEVELPIYTTCARLFEATGDIRKAVISSALDYFVDLGGARINEALRIFLAARNAPTLLVIDSLDEAHGRSARLRQVGSLPWRVVLTSRPGSWLNQFPVNSSDSSHRVGRLQPLRYPADVEAFILRWFSSRPDLGTDRGTDLATQIAGRRDLQETATVPLILAFYCLIGGSEPLPDFRTDLYPKVLSRMLTGRWRDEADRYQDVDTGACLQKLADWAWAAATSDAASEIGTWKDDFTAERSRLSPADNNALDHVAALSPPSSSDLDPPKIRRRFLHRSIREHLVAQRVASLSLNEAADVLLPHLWYDPDWEYAAPAAIASHPLREDLLRRLIYLAAGQDEAMPDLPAIDGRMAFTELLTKIAALSRQNDWSPPMAAMISQARTELGTTLRGRGLAYAAFWPTSTSEARVELMRWGLSPDLTSGEACRVVTNLVRMAATPDEKYREREELLTVLAMTSYGWTAEQFAAGIAQLDPTPNDRHRARDELLRLLGARHIIGREAAQLIARLAELAPETDEKLQARTALLALLSRSECEPRAGELAAGLLLFDPTANDKRHARTALLTLLDRQSAGSAPEWDDIWAGGWATSLCHLDPATSERLRARTALLALLARQTDNGFAAAQLAFAVTITAQTADDKREIRTALLGLLAQRPGGSVTAALARGVAALEPPEDERRQAREVVTDLLASQPESVYELGSAVLELAVTANETRQARTALIRILTTEGYSSPESLAGTLADLDPTPEDKTRICNTLMTLLTDEPSAWKAARLGNALADFDPNITDRAKARHKLLQIMPSQTGGQTAAKLADAIARLDPTADDKRRARDALLQTLIYEHDTEAAAPMVSSLARLSPTVRDLANHRDWYTPPTQDLLAEVRRNSPITDWIATLPSLS